MCCWIWSIHHVLLSVIYPTCVVEYDLSIMCYDQSIMCCWIWSIHHVLLSMIYPSCVVVSCWVWSIHHVLLSMIYPSCVVEYDLSIMCCWVWSIHHVLLSMIYPSYVVEYDLSIMCYVWPLHNFRYLSLLIGYKAVASFIITILFLKRFL